MFGDGEGCSGGRKELLQGGKQRGGMAGIPATAQALWWCADLIGQATT